MEIKYKIINIDTDNHQIVVRFYAGDATKELCRRFDFPISVPIPAPTGDDLRDIILKYAPRELIARQEKICDPTIDTSMISLLEEVGVLRSCTTEDLQAALPRVQSIHPITVVDLPVVEA